MKQFFFLVLFTFFGSFVFAQSKPKPKEKPPTKSEIQNSLPIAKLLALIFKNHPQIGAWKNCFGLI